VKPLQVWLDEYGESHQNKINKKIHWICVPAIMFSIFGILLSIPHNYLPVISNIKLNWALITLALTLFYYFKLSKVMALGMFVVGVIILWGNHLIEQNYQRPLWIFSVIIFVIAWIGQFIGHKIEGKKPSFIKDLQFLLIGPAWLLSFIYIKIGIKY